MDAARNISYFSKWSSLLNLVLLLSTLFFFRPTVVYSQKASTEQTESEDKGKNRAEASQESLLQKMANTVLDDHPVDLFGSPHFFSVLPLAYYDFRTGINVGFQSLLIAGTNARPTYKLRLQVLASSKGSHKHKLFFQAPQIIGSKFGIHFRGEWERDLEARYFGKGNNSIYNQRLTDTNTPEYIDEDYYLYNLKRPRFTIHGTVELLSNLWLWLGYGFQSVDPQLKSGTATSYLGTEQPFGHLGGAGQHLSFKLVWDTRHPRVFPRFGALTEISVEPNFDSVREEVVVAEEPSYRNRSVSYTRYTFSDAHFISLTPRLVFANRIAFEGFTGDPPYYAFGDFGTIRQTRAVGGSQSLRGFQSRRFQDKLKFITLTELRFKAVSDFELFAQSFDLILVGFFDNGRVWSSWSDLSVDGFHKTYGMGVWVNWNKNLILRLDVGRSPEQIIPYFRIHSAF